MEEQRTLEGLRKDVLDTLAYCINCRFCLPSCPRFDITTGEVSQGASGITRSLYYAIKWGMADKETLSELRDLLYSCMTCKSCEIACKNLSTGTKLLDAIEKGRQILIEEMVGPMPRQKMALESLIKYGNPYGMPPSKRKAWLKGLNVPSVSYQSEMLLYVGCTAPNEPDVQRAAMSCVQLLQKAQIQFGILEDEVCCGYPSLKMGERGLFEEIAEKNVKQFMTSEVKHIVTLSPHCFDTFSNRYPKEAIEKIKVQHYIQFLSDLIQEKRIVFRKKIEKKVIYQDSCYLGRHNNIYDEPRMILRSIPGIEVIEFRRSKADGTCCGGGGGRMWADFDTEVNRLSCLRVREALERGAELVVAACPWCRMNLTDGTKLANAEDLIGVKDIAELCLEAT